MAVKRVIALAAVLAVMGCANKKPPQANATELNPPAQPPVPYVPATQPAAQPQTAYNEVPVPAETAPAAAPTAAHAHKHAAAKPAPKAAAAQGKISGKKYVVKAGDTLSEIAQRKYGTTKKVKDILKANPGLDPDKIKTGQVIILP
jgi:nucleoid-associated protein YgaU